MPELSFTITGFPLMSLRKSVGVLPVREAPAAPAPCCGFAFSLIFSLKDCSANGLRTVCTFVPRGQNGGTISSFFLCPNFQVLPELK